MNKIQNSSTMLRLFWETLTDDQTVIFNDVTFEYFETLNRNVILDMFTKKDAGMFVLEVLDGYIGD